MKVIFSLFLSIFLFACTVPGKKQHTPLPEPEPAGANLVRESCGRKCHGPPTPSAYKATEWPAIVDRMQVYWVKRKLGVIPEEDRKILLDYLQKHGAK